MATVGTFNVGRSPRTRGSLYHRRAWARYARSIPAHAGEPSWLPLILEEGMVDPRARGGASVRSVWSRPLSGRSPRTRGSQFAAPAAAGDAGSIPAHAGEPPAGLIEAVKKAGRSPRTRGSPILKRLQRPSEGSIPAHAGEPGLS